VKKKKTWEIETGRMKETNDRINKLQNTELMV